MGTMGTFGIKISKNIFIADMASNFFDNPASTYGYHNFLPGALDALGEDDDLVILPPDVDSLTDEEEFDEN